MFDINKILRPHIIDLKPYSSARDEYTGSVGIFLDANENSLGSATEENHNRYPDPLQRAIKAKLAPLKGVNPDQIFIGNGSDEAIDLLIRAFCIPGKDEILILPPTYGMYKVSANINDVAIKEVPLKEGFELNEEAIAEALAPHTKLFFICSPNNPSGNSLDVAIIERLLQKAKGLVVVDEAYIDFAPEKSVIPLLHKYPQLVVMQTFSKAWGLANLRIGMAFAHPDVIQVLNKIKPPYNVNGVTQEIALEALENSGRKDQMVEEILKQRAILREALMQLPMIEEVYPSDTNFLLAKTVNPDDIYNKLIDQQIIVRNRSRVLLCDGCLRITVGTSEENEQLLEGLRKYEV